MADVLQVCYLTLAGPAWLEEKKSKLFCDRAALFNCSACLAAGELLERSLCKYAMLSFFSFKFTIAQFHSVVT